jgi:hypothetical protein
MGNSTNTKLIIRRSLCTEETMAMEQIKQQLGEAIDRQNNLTTKHMEFGLTLNEEIDSDILKNTIRCLYTQLNDLYLEEILGDESLVTITDRKVISVIATIAFENIPEEVGSFSSKYKINYAGENLVVERQ